MGKQNLRGSRCRYGVLAALAVLPMAAAVHQYAPKGVPLPIVFEPNQGQAGETVRYVSRSARTVLLLGDTEAVLSMRAGEGRIESLRMSLVGATRRAPNGLDQLPGRTNYLLGERSQWHTAVPHYSKVRYREVYPGIDWVYYGTEGQFEYDFVVQPGADPSLIRLRIDGATALSLTPGGDLVIRTNDGELVQRAPVVFQDTPHGRTHVAGRYVVADDNEVRFTIAAYDASLPLVIDPVLSYATYVGGNSADVGKAVSVDSAGNAYIAGVTFSTAQLATTGQTTHGGLADTFVAKLSPAGAILFATYFGGTGNDDATALTVASDGSVYVTGTTESVLPTTPNPIRAAPVGLDAFLLRLNSTGAMMQFTYLGGAGTDAGSGIAVNGESVYLAGQTNSADWTNALGGPGGGLDGWVAKVTGTALVWVRYLGGTGDDWINALATRAGNLYVAGETRSATFGILQPSGFAGGTSDAFAAGLTIDGGIVYGRRIGGAGNDTAYAIAVDTYGKAHVGGETTSADIATLNGWIPTPPGGTDGFLTILGTTGAISYSTFVGGTGTDRVRGIAIDPAVGVVFMTGDTTSSGWTFTHALTTRGLTDAFVVGLQPATNTVEYSTAIGGTQNDLGLGIAATTGNVYMVGYTVSAGITGATNSLNTTPPTIQDALVVRIQHTIYRPRLVLQNEASNGVAMWVLGGNGQTLLHSPFILTAAANWSVVASGDFNRDGIPDIVFQNQTNNMISIWYMGAPNGTGIVTAPIAATSSPNWQVVGSGDLNEDGTHDLLFQNSVTNQIAIWYMGGATGTTVLSDAIVASPVSGWRVTGVGDLDGNGASDIVFTNATSNGVSVWYRAPGQAFNVMSSPIIYYAAPDWRLVGVTNIDETGRNELVFQNNTNGMLSVWYLGNNGTSYSSSAYLQTPVSGWRVRATN